MAGASQAARLGALIEKGARSGSGNQLDNGGVLVGDLRAAANNDAATNGQSLHTRRHWFAAKSPSWRSRTRSWTPRGSPPKEAAGRRVKHKKMQIRAALSRRARALAESHCSCGIYSWRGPIDFSSPQPIPPAATSLPSNHACRNAQEPP